MKKNLYAVLVGIGHYPNLGEDKQLPGSLQDVGAVAQYLSAAYVKDDFERVELVKLASPVENGGLLPTKANIVRAFSDALAKAGPNDTVFFYFAGHGIREKTDIPAFAAAEIDGNIAGIAGCEIDLDQPDPGRAILCDKEIRYLLRQATQKAGTGAPPHLLLVFDCCHSGENTRNVAMPVMDATARQIVRDTLPVRAWGDFIFHEDPKLAADIQTEKNIDALLPESPHVMLAACRDLELSWEWSATGETLRQGAFSRALVDVLTQHRNRLSYEELYQRILNRMRFYANRSARTDQRQTPQFYYFSDQPAQRYHQFLSDKALPKIDYFPVEYMPFDMEWRMVAGALHGIPAQNTPPTQVEVFNDANPAQRWQAHPAAVYPAHTVLAWDGSPPTDLGLAYRAKVGNLHKRPLAVAIVGDPEAAVVVQRVFQTILQEDKAPMVSLVHQEAEADYLLLAEGGQLKTTRPFDRGRPLLLPFGYGPDTLEAKANSAFYDFVQMAQWVFLRDLECRAPGGPLAPVAFNVFEKMPDGTEKQVPLTNNQLLLELYHDEKRYIRFELVNNSAESYCCSLIYMPQTFGFLSAENHTLMKRPQAVLERQGDALKSINSKNDPESPYITFALGAYIKRDQWAGEEHYLKLIYSKMPFDIGQFYLKPLPSPDSQVLTTRFGKAAPTPAAPLRPDWEIRTYPFFIKNLGPR